MGRRQLLTSSKISFDLCRAGGLLEMPSSGVVFSGVNAELFTSRDILRGGMKRENVRSRYLDLKLSPRRAATLCCGIGRGADMKLVELLAL